MTNPVETIPSQAAAVAYKFETIGNAVLQVFQNDEPVLATDPWLKGTCYFGSWALSQPLTETQIRNVTNSKFIWISHGHPDHLHPESLELVPRNPGPRILLPNHYSSEIQELLESLGFSVQVLKFKQWTRLTPTLRVMCLEDMNQDAMLIIEAGDTLIIDKNDAPTYGEERFLRKLVSQYENSYLLALCAMDADMFNFVDEHNQPLRPRIDEAKAAVIGMTSQFCDYLGVKNFCCFSSQHLYVRQDSIWANPYRVTYEDMQKYWSSRARLIESFVTVDLQTGSVTQHHSTQESDLSQVTAGTGEDDWDEPMNEEDWRQLETFVRKFKILESNVDFIGFTVANENRTFYLKGQPRGNSNKRRGVNFIAPRHSLMETVKYGYFDDILIGNFMKTQLVNMKLYPKFCPYIAKFGGNAKVFTQLQLLKFRFHYFKLSPVAYIRWNLESWWVYTWKNRTRSALRKLRLLEFVKRVNRRL